jgi:adenylylsulfate kinase
VGQIKDLTGPQDLYEEPLQPDLIVDTEKLTVQESVNSIMATLQQLGITH